MMSSLEVRCRRGGFADTHYHNQRLAPTVLVP